ncbi:2-methylaconitate cis-trans isomerase PrpF family protein [Neoroseomonas lacus]|uniref:Methylaconitate Delta-isomerase PrpF n=1 Tax=Neoroseomonas lacus TaxID=287609 RepID=A0A917K4M0_9PROT|nr:PrpF domain-containing protein [Neoroseomonas lacus]GGI98806.1 putative methylaconitate Delta-isomerase PrpF [Neoroseomonas lacus]
MDQAFIPAVFLRGGSSKGVFFHAKDLPADRAKQDAIFLSVLGSPDPYGRQLDGMGGGISSLSKAVIIGPPTHPEADVDYTFAQVAVDRPLVDWSSNCGNLSSAVGPFAVDEGLVRASDGEALVRIHQVNTKRIIHARFLVRGRRAATEGDFVMAGVSGSGARIRLDFLAPGGGATGTLLPTGHAIDVLEHCGRRYRATLVDAANACVFLDAAELGLAGTEGPDAIEAQPTIMALLDALRRVAAVRMGLCATPEAAPLAIPKVAVVSAPANYRALDGQTIGATTHEVAVRMISMERAHRAVPLTGGMALGVACRIEGSLPQLIAAPSRDDEVRLANPSGILSVGAEVRRDGAGWFAESAVVFRSARRLMQGSVAVPTRLL